MKSFILSIPKYVPSLIMILVALYFTFDDNPLGVNGLKIFPYAEQVGHFILYFLVALVFILDYAKSKLPHHSKINQEMALAAVSAVMALLLEIGLMWRTNCTGIFVLPLLAVAPVPPLPVSLHTAPLALSASPQEKEIKRYC